MNAWLQKKTIFISYRRSDTGPMAGRIRDRLDRELPGFDVFLDTASIPPGAAFRRDIGEAIKGARTFLLLIGENFATRRRWTDDDHLRFEIATALAAKVRILPILIEDARMPEADELPEDIRGIVELNGLEIRHTRFDDDVANLARAIGGHARPGAASSKAGFARSVKAALAGMATAVAATLVALIVLHEATQTSASDWLGASEAMLLFPVMAVVGGLAGYAIQGFNRSGT